MCNGAPDPRGCWLGLLLILLSFGAGVVLAVLGYFAFWRAVALW